MKKLNLNSKWLALDIETKAQEGRPKDDALNFHKNIITIGAISDGETGEVVRSLDEWSKYSQCSFVTHGGKFDFKNLKKHGAPIEWSQYAHDTLLMATTLAEKIPEAWLEEYDQYRISLNKEAKKQVHRQAGKHSLKTLAPYFLGVDPFWETEDHDNEEYVIKDALYTAQLAEVLEQKLKTQGGWDFYNNYLLPWNRMLMQAEYRGTQINFDTLREFEIQYKQLSDEAEATLKRVWAPYYEKYNTLQIEKVYTETQQKKAIALAKLVPSKKKDPEKAALEDFEKRSKCSARYELAAIDKIKKIKPLNLASPIQLKWLLKDCMNLDVTTFDGKSESTGKAILERLAKEEVQGIPEFMEYRKANKLVTAFFPSYREEAIGNVIHTTFNIDVARTGRLTSNNPNCLSMDTQILTPEGWKYYNELKETTQVAAYNPNTNEIEFEVPQGYITTEATSMVEFKNQHFDWRVSANHRCLIRDRKTRQFKVVEAKDLKPYFQVLHGGISKGSVTLSKDVIAFILAVQADGHYNNKLYLSFGLKKRRKIERLKALLQRLNLPFTLKVSSRGVTTIYLGRAGDHLLTPYLDLPSRKFTAALLKLSEVCRRYLLEEARYWDGLSTRKPLMYTSKYESNVDILQALSAITGKRSHKTVSIVDGKKYYRLYNTDKEYSLTTNAIKTIVDKKEVVWCPKVTTSFILVRRGSDTFITGNCQQISKKILPLFEARKGYKLIYRDVSAVEPRLIAYTTECQVLCDIFLNGSDFHSENVRAMLGIQEDDATIKKQYKPERDLAKEVGLALMYGAMHKRIQECAAKRGFNWTEKECKRMYRAFQEKYEEVWEYKRQLEAAIVRGEPIFNLFGRPLNFDLDRLHMQSLNTQIQSGGSDILLASICDAVNKCAERNIEAHPLLFIHDASAIEAPEAVANEVDKIVVDTISSWKLPTKWGNIPMMSEGAIVTRMGAE